MTATPRPPRGLAAATTLLERFAQLEGELARIEARRDTSIARANAAADKAGEALISERDTIRARLSLWWTEAGQGLVDGKRKSIELGGCIIGSRAGRDALEISVSEDEAVDRLRRHDWAEPLLRVKVAIDKVAVLKSLDGVYAGELAAIGFARRCGVETFVLERAGQAGVLSEVKR